MTQETVSWTNALPGGWESIALGRIAVPEKRTNITDAPLLSLYLGQGILPYKTDRVVHATSEDTSGYQLVLPGDLVFNNQQAWRGSVAVSRLRGIISPAYIVCRLSPRLNTDFAGYLFASPAARAPYEVSSRGVGDIQRNLSWRVLRSEQFPLPPLAEQRVIATFLDRETAEIDDLVLQQESLVAALRERRTSLVANVAMHGFDRDIAKKDSGLKWVGEIPAHWRTAPLGSLVRQVKNKNIGGNETNLLSLSHGQIKRRDIKSDDGLLPESFDGYVVVERDDIVFRFTDLQNDQRSLRSALVRERGIITSAYVSTRPGPEVTSGFLNYLMRGYDTSKVFYGMGAGVRQSLTFEEVKRLPTLLPPLDEQRRIADYLDERTAEIDSLISKAEAFTALAKERRSALITAAVTGQIDCTHLINESEVT